jgi:chaperone BCS1
MNLKYGPYDLSARCILLLEDLDAAFTRSVSRDSTSTGAPTVPTTATKASKENNDGSTLSLSGLLNSLDGVAAAEGRYVLSTDLHDGYINDVTS